MASVKKGILTPPKERWRHLGFLKRSIWKRERRAGMRLARAEAGFANRTSKPERDD